MQMQMLKAAFKNLDPSFLISSQQPCKISEAESELLDQGHPGRYMAKEGSGSSISQWNSLTITPALGGGIGMGAGVHGWPILRMP